MASPAFAVNDSFETGDTSGWMTSSGNAFATTSFPGYAAVDGSFFGVAQAGDGAGVYTTLSQIYTLSAGSTLSGFVGFLAGDYLPYDDDGYLSVNGVNIFTASVGTLGTNGSSGWVPFSFVAPTAGAYKLELGARHLLDNGGGLTGAVIDGVTVASVPEPATWGLMIGGFAMTGFAMRRRSTMVAA